MKSDDDQPSGGAQELFSGDQRPRELAKLVIDEYPQRLKDARRRMDAIFALRRRGAADNFCKTSGRFNRRALSRFNNRPSDASGALFFAIDLEDGSKIAGFRRIHDIRRIGLGAIHAHRQRAVPHEGEPARRFVELHGGYAEIEDDSINRIDLKFGETVLNVGKWPAYKGETARIGARPVPRALDRGRIAIKSVDGAIGGRENGAGITAAAKGRVDIKAVRRRRQRRDRLIQHHRRVNGECHAASPALGLRSRCSAARARSRVKARRSSAPSAGITRKNSPRP